MSDLTKDKQIEELMRAIDAAGPWTVEAALEMYEDVLRKPTILERVKKLWKNM